MLPKKEPLHKESITEKAIRLMGQKTVIQYHERGELCAMYGILIRLEATNATKERPRRLVLWEPNSQAMWHIPMSIVTEIKAGG